MNGSELYLGSHLSLKAPDFYLATCQTALAYGENAFMFYTSSPQSARRLSLETLKISEGRAFLKNHGFDESKIVVHAPYILNLGNNSRPEAYSAGIALLKEEIQRTAAFGVSWLVLHPGNATGLPVEESLKAVAAGLDQVFDEDGTSVTICLETMAGKGSEVGKSFDELARIIALSHHQDRLGICLDTCHINDAGMDETHFDFILDKFDKILGLDRLKVIHLNDSKNPIGSHKDRHENLGYGTLGFATLSAIAWEPRLRLIPKILETPTDGIHDPYSREIAMLRANEFIPGWRETL
jgi:deoxyribonuclease-4